MSPDELNALPEEQEPSQEETTPACPSCQAAMYVVSVGENLAGIGCMVNYACPQCGRETTEVDGVPQPEEPATEPEKPGAVERERLAQNITIAMQRAGLSFDMLAGRAHLHASTLKRIVLDKERAKDNTIGHISTALGLPDPCVLHYDTAAEMMEWFDFLDAKEARDAERRGLARTVEDRPAPKRWWQRPWVNIVGGALTCMLMAGVVSLLMWLGAVLER